MSDVPADYRLACHLYAIEELDSAEGRWFANLDIGFTLTRASDRQTVLRPIQRTGSVRGRPVLWSAPSVPPRVSHSATGKDLDGVVRSGAGIIASESAPFNRVSASGSSHHHLQEYRDANRFWPVVLGVSLMSPGPVSAGPGTNKPVGMPPPRAADFAIGRVGTCQHRDPFCSADDHPCPRASFYGPAGGRNH